MPGGPRADRRDFYETMGVPLVSVYEPGQGSLSALRDLPVVVRDGTTLRVNVVLPSGGGRAVTRRLRAVTCTHDGDHRRGPSPSPSLPVVPPERGQRR